MKTFWRKCQSLRIISIATFLIIFVDSGNASGTTINYQSVIDKERPLESVRDDEQISVFLSVPYGLSSRNYTVTSLSIIQENVLDHSRVESTAQYLPHEDGPTLSECGITITGIHRY